MDVPSLGDLTDGEFLLLPPKSQEELKVEKQVSLIVKASFKENNKTECIMEELFFSGKEQGACPSTLSC